MLRMINTGEPRNILGHIVSGAVASAVISGAVNYKKYKENKINKNEAIKDTAKMASQGAIATGSAIATANYIGSNNPLKALSAISVGFLGIYALEVMEDKINDKYLTNTKTKLIEE
ncbi:MAG: hypothetical protein KGV43_02510 [Arcobacter sp.]|nr:hypothetical protein [Arcobacter sp.]